MNQKILLAALVFALGGCTKVIEIDLNSAAPKVVIDAELQSGTHDFEVKISRTANYFGTDQPATVDAATVFLKKGSDAPQKLTAFGSGKYGLQNFTATENEAYILTVEVDGQTFEATDFLPKKVSLDSLSVEKAENGPNSGPFGGSSKPDTFQVVCHFQDPSGEANFYRIRTRLNGLEQMGDKHLLVVEDRLTDGNAIQIPIFTDTFSLGDSVEVELVSMSKNGFEYFNSLAGLVGSGGGSAAPANPNSSWSGGALGFFGAVSVSKKAILVR